MMRETGNYNCAWLARVFFPAVDESCDTFMEGVLWVGLMMSLWGLVVCGRRRRRRSKAYHFAALVWMYGSMVDIGDAFMSFQWDVLLLECGIGCAIGAAIFRETVRSPTTPRRVDTASDFVQVDAHERMRKNSIALQNVAKFNRTGVSLCDTAVAEWVFSTDCEWDEPEVQEDWRGFNVPRRRTVGVSDHRANEDGKKRGVFGSDFVSNWDYVERELRIFQSFNDCVGDGELRGRREEDG